MSRRRSVHVLGCAIGTVALTGSALAALESPAQAATTTFFVASSGNDTFDCSAAQPCATVQRALNRVTVDGAADGQDAVINVPGGSFTGANLVLPGGSPTSLTLTGAGAAATTLVGGDTGLSGIWAAVAVA